MLKADLQTVPVSAADVMAIDALFKRIAERGRKIRSQKLVDNPAQLEASLTSEEVQSHNNVRVENSSSEIGNENLVLGA